MKDLLVCVSHHDDPTRLQFLRSVLQTFSEYPLSVDIIIDTNAVGLDEPGENIVVCEHPNLEHPFYLTWLHRFHMRDLIDQYRWLCYVENDMVIPYQNFQNYQRNFALLWPSAIPSFIRVEEYEGEEWVVDVTNRQTCEPVVEKDGIRFVALREAYHGLWILPQQALKDSMTPDFARFSQSRETAASFALWELQKTGLVQLDGKQVSRLSYSYHVSNTYARCATLNNSKIRVADIFL